MARARGDVRTAVDELLDLTDTWYADVEAWLELADIYANCALYVFYSPLAFCFPNANERPMGYYYTARLWGEKINRYPQSLTALSHALLLNPQNPFHVLRAAETAYTALDVPLALKFFLRAVEMMDEAADEHSGGATTRGWYGVKLVSKANPLPLVKFSFPPPSLSRENVTLVVCCARLTRILVLSAFDDY